MVRRLMRILLIACCAGLLGVVLVTGWLKLHEEKLIFAADRGRQHMLTVLPADAERVTVPEPNGVALASIVYHGIGGGAFWILHLHGNADSAFSPWQVRHCEALRQAGFNVLEIDYRGFGPTPGRPSEAHMYEDSEAAYQELLRRGVPDDHIILLGHSLGSGPAVLLATRHPAAALVLFGAFTSIPDAAAHVYPYLPVRLVVSAQFNSLARIGKVHIPVIIAHSRTDKLIPYSQGLELFAAANQPKHFITFDSPTNDGFGGHVDALYEHVDILKAALAQFVPAIQPAPER